MSELKYFFLILITFQLNGQANTHAQWTARTTKVEFITRANPGGLKIQGTTNSDSGGSDSILSTITEASGELSGNLNINLETLDTGIELRNKHMKENYLETSKFKNATFTFSGLKVESIKNAAKSGSAIPVIGTMNLHGKSNLITAQMRPNFSDNTLKFQLTSIVKLSDYAVKIPEFMGIKVENEVQLIFNYEGIKK